MPSRIDRDNLGVWRDPPELPVTLATALAAPTRRLAIARALRWAHNRAPFKDPAVAGAITILEEQPHDA